MRSPHKNRPALPASPEPLHDHLGRVAMGWAKARDEAQPHTAALIEAAPLRAAAAVIDSLDEGGRTDLLAQRLAQQVTARRGASCDPMLWAVADCARLAAELETSRQALPWAWAAALAAERFAGWPLAAAAPHTEASASRVTALTEAIEVGDGAAASAAVLAQLAAQVPSKAVLTQLAQAACRHPGDGGVAVVAVAKIADLVDVAGEQGLVSALAATARDLAERPQRLAWTTGHRARMQALAPRLQACASLRDDDKARAFVEPKFRAHLLDATPDQTLKAVLRAAEVGVPHELLAMALVLAAAERLLRLDRRNDRETAWSEGYADGVQLLILASAVRQIRTWVDPADWLGLLLFAAGLVSASATLDLPEAERLPLPEPAALHQTWDHGPEIAKVVTNLLAGRGEQAIAVLRAYFLLVLPEQPLCSQLREAAMADRWGEAVEQARAIALMAAAVDEFQAASASPHRELILAAALRTLATPPPPRRTLAALETLLLRRDLGWQPQARVGSGPLPADK